MRHARHVPEKALLGDMDAEQLRNLIEQSAIVSASFAQGRLVASLHAKMRSGGTINFWRPPHRRNARRPDSC